MERQIHAWFQAKFLCSKVCTALAHMDREKDCINKMVAMRTNNLFANVKMKLMGERTPSQMLWGRIYKISGLLCCTWYGKALPSCLIDYGIMVFCEGTFKDSARMVSRPHFDFIICCAWHAAVHGSICSQLNKRAADSSLSRINTRSQMPNNVKPHCPDFVKSAHMYVSHDDKKRCALREKDNWYSIQGNALRKPSSFLQHSQWLDSQGRNHLVSV